MLAMTASCSCLATIAIILSQTQNKPLAAWRFFINLNAVIAIFATAAKASLLMAVSSCIAQEKRLYFKQKPRPLVHLDVFDEGSRGPLGAVKIITNVPWGWARFGAAIVILALATDTFIQQLIVFDPVNVYADDSSATFNYSQTYDTSIGALAGSPGTSLGKYRHSWNHQTVAG